MGSIDYNVFVDRDSNTLDFNINYSIPAYIDPETGETFSDTSWTATYAEIGGSGGGTGGFGSESESVTLNFGLASDPNLHRYTLDFTAMSTFSADSVSQHWAIQTSAYATDSQALLGGSGIDVLIGGSGDDVLRGYAQDDILDAGAGDDIVDGGAGNDRIDGGTGRNILIGGAGNDIYILSSTDDTIVEYAGGGADMVFANVGYTLAANVEALQLIGGGAINGTGNADANSIAGNIAANVLSGLDGNDDLHGGDGRDTLYGGAANDWLDGGTGIDAMAGGLGDDRYDVDTIRDTVTELAGQGIDTVYAAISSYTLGANVENLVHSSFGSFRGTGNSLANVLTGGGQNDMLDGLAGNDTLIGGGGNDTLVGGTGADRLDGGAGIDTASYAGATTALAVNLATGSASGGEASGDRLTAIENVTAGAGNDVLRGDAGANGLTGNDGDDDIRGADGNDVLVGGAGADLLAGQAGADRLTGGAGDDIFLFGTGYGRDTILDFAAGAASGDVIRLSLGSAFDSFGEVMAVAQASGANTVFRFGADTTLTLINVNPASLNAGDFAFV